MIFIDFITLLLINMAAGLVVLAAYVTWGLGSPDQRRWAPAFGMAGLVALVAGFYMTFTWPVPGSYNSAFGEMSVLFGVIYLGLAAATAKGLDLLPVSIYSLFAGLAAVLLGVRILDLKLTQTPALSAVGFILSGLGGVLLCVVLALRTSRAVRIAFSLVLVVAALIWAVTAYGGYWMHMKHFGQWKPSIVQMPQEQPQAGPGTEAKPGK